MVTVWYQNHMTQRSRVQPVILQTMVNDTHDVAVLVSEIKTTLSNTIRTRQGTASCRSLTGLLQSPHFLYAGTLGSVAVWLTRQLYFLKVFQHMNDVLPSLVTVTTIPWLEKRVMGVKVFSKQCQSYIIVFKQGDQVEVRPSMSKIIISSLLGQNNTLLV